MQNPNVTRLAGIVLATTLAIASLMLAAPTSSARPSPDVHVVSVDRWCGTSEATVYRLGLANYGDQRRTARINVTRQGGFGSWSAHRISEGRRAGERLRIAKGERASVVVRSQRRVILRTELVGDCARRF